MSERTAAGLGVVVISALFCLTSICSEEAWLAAHTRLQPTLWWTGLAGVALVVPMLGLGGAHRE